MRIHETKLLSAPVIVWFFLRGIFKDISLSEQDNLLQDGTILVALFTLSPMFQLDQSYMEIRSHWIGKLQMALHN